ncbi:MarR family winged helix-turn-helix transcriptional regulator [Nocardia brasiliensis]|uniref:MarR family winged helix-turn-helix transcriptional regulator n=1 Tax=Nocardia brasiliensis TaxID=37326 RepID=UPI003670C761
MAAVLPEQGLGYLLITQFNAVSTQMSAAVGSALRDLDLTEPSANLLWLLDPDTDPPSMTHLADRLGCDPSTVTFLVDKLEKRGSVQRRASRRDGRVKVVALTAAGIEQRRKLVEAMTARSPMARLSTKEQQQLHRLLSKATSRTT